MKKPDSLVLPPGTKPPNIPPDHHVSPKHPLPVRLICNSDDHHPIVDKYYEAALFAFARDFKPDCWVHLGDRYDLWSLSRFDKEPRRWFENGLLQNELSSAVESWNEMCAISKNVHFILGNHEDRLNRLVKANMGLFGLKAFNWHQMADIPQQVKMHEFGAVLDIGGVQFEHGYQVQERVVNPAQWMLNNRRANTIFGHTHRIATQYATFRRDGHPVTLVAHNQGHGSDVSKQTYAGPCPSWQHGFTAFEFWTEGSKPRFSMHPITVINGRFSWGGRLYDGRKTQ